MKNLFKMLSIFLTLIITSCATSQEPVRSSAEEIKAYNKAKDYIDSKANYLAEWNASMKKVSTNANKVKELRSELKLVIEDMRTAKARLYDPLNEQQKKSIEAYQDTKITIAQEAFDFLQPCEASKNFVATALHTNTQKTTQFSSGGYCYCIGFLICHARCCVNDSGRGVRPLMWACGELRCDGCP
jgi:hypothetical protein